MYFQRNIHMGEKRRKPVDYWRACSWTRWTTMDNNKKWLCLKIGHSQLQWMCGYLLFSDKALNCVSQVQMGLGRRPGPKLCLPLPLSLERWVPRWVGDPRWPSLANLTGEDDRMPGWDIFFLWIFPKLDAKSHRKPWFPVDFPLNSRIEVSQLNHQHFMLFNLPLAVLVKYSNSAR